MSPYVRKGTKLERSYRKQRPTQLIGVLLPTNPQTQVVVSPDFVLSPIVEGAKRQLTHLLLRDSNVPQGPWDPPPTVVSRC